MNIALILTCIILSAAASSVLCDLKMRRYIKAATKLDVQHREEMTNAVVAAVMEYIRKHFEG